MAMIRMKKGNQTAWIPLAEAAYFRSVGWVRVVAPAPAVKPAKPPEPALEPASGEETKTTGATKPGKATEAEAPELAGPKSRKEPDRKPAT